MPHAESEREAMPAGVAARVSQLHREEWARVVAGLARRCGDLDLAEEMAAEAFASAIERWPIEGLPPNPGGWITTTAYRKAIDRLRREAQRDSKHLEALMLHDADPPAPTGAIDDDRLRLLFTCCHPVLPPESRVALTLRIVGGLTVPEIARAFLVPEATVRQRITRAKAKIKSAGIPFAAPAAEDLPARIDGVLSVLYLVFNEGYFASGADTSPIRRDLTGEAIRLARIVRELLPGDSEAAGLLALMLLTEARAGARLSDDRELVRMDEQDREAWDRGLIAEGLAIVRDEIGSVTTGQARSGRYALLARINAIHVAAPHARDTDWKSILALYERLERVDPNPIVTLNRAIAVAELESPEAALAIVDDLRDSLDGFHAFHVVRAELLRAGAREPEARDSYDLAIGLASNTAEIAHLKRRRDQLASSPVPRDLGDAQNGEIE